MKKYSSLHKGFTLVELMIVIAIIGILAAVLYPSLTGYLERTRDTNRQQGMNQLGTALGTYYTDMNGYPANTDTNKCLKGVKTALTGGNVKYLKNLPKDPQLNTSSKRVNSNCDETGYVYAPQNLVGTISFAENYVAAAKMEIATNGNMAFDTAPAGVTAPVFTALSAVNNKTVSDISSAILTKQQLGTLAAQKQAVFAVYNQ